MEKLLLLTAILSVVIILSNAGKRSKYDWDDYFKDESPGNSCGCFVDDVSKDVIHAKPSEKSFKKVGFKANNRAKFPHHGHYKPHLHPFFSNITADDLKHFSQIITNRNLTKYELKTSLEKWAAGLGSEAEEEFKKLEEHQEKLREAARNNTVEILKNITNLFEKIANIKDNMNITRGEERGQISAVFKKEAPVTVRIMHLIENAAFRMLDKH